MYRLRDYLAMLSDEGRVAAYRRAIQAQVRPGDRVIELGAGLGFFSMLAVRAGAAFVDAVDVNPVVHLGSRIAAANGCADRIRFHQAELLGFVPDARADVIIGDMRGPTPFAGRALETVIDARTRMLRDGGLLVGRSDRLYVAPARHPATFRRQVAQPLARLDVDLSAAAAIASDTPFQCAIATSDLLVPPQSWGELDYTRLETASHSGSAEWQASGHEQIEGLAVWFEADLGGGVTFSAAPGGDAATYGQLYLPLRSPVDVRAGERFRVDVGARYSAGDYVWMWTICVAGDNGRTRVCQAQNSLAERIIDPKAFETVAL